MGLLIAPLETSAAITSAPQPVVPENYLYLINTISTFPGGFGAVKLPAGTFPVSNPGRQWQKWVRGPGMSSNHLWEPFFATFQFIVIISQ